MPEKNRKYLVYLEEVASYINNIHAICVEFFGETI